MSPSEAQLLGSEQTRNNGAKSKRSNTNKGKAKSLKNSLKHGVAANVNTLIAPDDSEAWHTHLTGYRESYRPSDYQENDLVNLLASLSWRQARLVGVETALLDYQLCVEEQRINEIFPNDRGNPYLQLALAWQALAQKALPRAAEPEMDTGVESLELVRRYQVSLDRQFRSTLLNLSDYRLQASRNRSKLNNAPTQIDAGDGPNHRAA